MSERMTDKNAIRVALLIAIDTEESLIDAYGGNRDEVGVQIAAKRIAAFKRVHERYFGALPGDPMPATRTVSIMTLMRGG